MGTLYENLLGGSITNDPLTSGATTINSTAFQYLPTVTAPDVMYLTLDPAAANGAPEIVKVTAHSAAATSVTVVRGQQDTDAREHPMSTAWLHGLTEADVDEFLKVVNTANITDAAVTLAKLAAAVTDRLPQAGDVKATVSTTEAGGWKNHNQTLTNAQSVYPALWAVAPASWKSGSNLTIPDLSSVALIGSGTVASLGALAGANTISLALSNLPAHSHSSPAHVHTVPAHGHTASTSGVGDHQHSTPAHSHDGELQHVSWANRTVSGAGGTAVALAQENIGGEVAWTGSGIRQVSSSGGGTSGAAGGHDHTVTVNNAPAVDTSGYTGSATTGSVGSGAAFSIVSRSMGVNFQVLAY